MTTYCYKCKKELKENGEKYLVCERCRSFTPSKSKERVSNIQLKKRK